MLVISEIQDNQYLQKQTLEVLCKEKVFLEIFQNLQENSCVRDSFLIKLQTLQLLENQQHWYISNNPKSFYVISVNSNIMKVCQQYGSVFQSVISVHQ